ncbi:MAG: hypothetical protein EPN93_20450 [Spirochaetes bacterium]|nr:MAG: hypothetical protein EPN93_20450 [Spirochaetota bacterium]
MHEAQVPFVYLNPELQIYFLLISPSPVGVPKGRLRTGGRGVRLRAAFFRQGAFSAENDAVVVFHQRYSFPNRIARFFFLVRALNETGAESTVMRVVADHALLMFSPKYRSMNFPESPEEKDELGEEPHLYVLWQRSSLALIL